MIEIHEGTSGYYLHDPDDHLRFGPQDVYNTYTAARVAAGLETTRRERVRNRTGSKTLVAAQ